MFRKKALIVYLSIVVPVMVISLFIIISGNASIFVSSFAIDSSENVYIGEDSKIKVYDNNVLVRTINPNTSRGYAFSIRDDKIVLSNTTIVYTLDLHGNVISQQADEDMKIFNKLQKSRKHQFVNGKEYVLSNNLGRTKILRNGVDVIYLMPLFDYAVKLTFMLIIISVFVFVPIFVSKIREQCFNEVS